MSIVVFTYITLYVQLFLLYNIMYSYIYLHYRYSYIYLFICSYIYFLLLEHTLTGGIKSLDSNGSATRGSNFMALPDCTLVRCSLA